MAILSEHLDEGRRGVSPENSNALSLQVARIGARATTQFEDPGTGTWKPLGEPAQERVDLRWPRSLPLVIPVQLGTSLIGVESHVAGIGIHHHSILVPRSPSPLGNAGSCVTT